jgi:hypothetical protein
MPDISPDLDPRPKIRGEYFLNPLENFINKYPGLSVGAAFGILGATVFLPVGAAAAAIAGGVSFVGGFAAGQLEKSPPPDTFESKGGND